MTDEANETKQSPIQLGEATLETGAPPLAPRAAFGGGGPKGSRYDPVLDKIPDLKAGEGGGYIKVSLEGETDKDKAIGALRVAIKRRLGKEEAKKIKVRLLEGNSVGVFRVA